MNKACQRIYAASLPVLITMGLVVAEVSVQGQGVHGPRLETQEPNVPIAVTLEELEASGVPLPEEPLPETAAPATFESAVFIGDSRTEGFHLYSGLKEGQYFCSVGATISSIGTKATELVNGVKVPILDALSQVEFDRVYIMLGINELGWPQADAFQEEYRSVLQRIQTEHPGVKIAIQSIIPVSALRNAKGDYINNERIAMFNVLLRELAVDTGCTYLNVAEAVCDENGFLRSDWNFDGVHLNPDGCKAWLAYLQSHPL